MTPLFALAALMLAAPAPADDDVQDLVILGEARPILVRLRVSVGDRPFRAAWLDTIRALHGRLDGDGDGRLTTEEADKGGLASLLAPSGAAPAGKGAGADNAPKDGVVSVDELAEALREASGPFRLKAEGTEGRRTDALFEHLDRDKDGDLTRPEMAALVGSLRRLDRDDNELIGADEVNPEGAPAPVASTMMGRPARDASVPPALELVAGESPLRVVRALLRKYDTGSGRGPGRPDSRLSPEEFAIPAEVFKAADANRDGSLNTEELRRYLERAPRDATLDVVFPADASGQATARIRGGDGGPPEGLSIRQLAEGVAEVDVGAVRLDVRVDDGAGAADAARKAFKARFDAADANQDGYLEESELAQDDGQPSPLAPLFGPLDRDGDKKIYPGEIEAYVARQAEVAQGSLTLTASDQGRALFGLLDLDRDRRLGAREVLDTSARVAACDRDRDGRVAPDEIPHHIQVTVARGDLSALFAPAANTPAAVAPRAVVAPPPARPAVGPDWFRKMDRNRDGDVSRREFLGTREQFDRLDRDRDGLVAPAEAEAASAARPVKAPGG